MLVFARRSATFNVCRGYPAEVGNRHDWGSLLEYIAAHRRNWSIHYLEKKWPWIPVLQELPKAQQLLLITLVQQWLASCDVKNIVLQRVGTLFSFIQFCPVFFADIKHFYFLIRHREVLFGLSHPSWTNLTAKCRQLTLIHEFTLFIVSVFQFYVWN